MNRDVPTHEQISNYMRDSLMASVGISQEDADYFMYKLKQDTEDYKREKLRQYERRRTGGCKSILFTFSMDNDLSPDDTIKKMYTILDLIRSKNYVFFDKSAMCVFEYYSSNGTWNPHIHIYNDQVIKPSKAGIRLHNFFVLNEKNRKKYSIYNVNAKQGNSKYQLGYVIASDKKESKAEDTQSDQNFRESHNIPHSINLY